MIEPWLKAHLEATGVWNSDGISRRAHSVRCRTCGAWTLAGLDADRCGLSVAVDADPLTSLGEALALVADRRTYRLSFGPGHLILDRRDRWFIAATPADDLTGADVVAEHACRAPPLPRRPSRLPIRRTQELPDEAPF